MSNLLEKKSLSIPFLSLSLTLFLFTIFPGNTYAQQAPCPSSEMTCNHLDYTYPDGCSSNCIRVVTKHGGPGGRGGAILAKCQCQEPTADPGSLACGEPCQGEEYCGIECPYCWGEFHQEPKCQWLTRKEALGRRQNPNAQLIFCNGAGKPTHDPNITGKIYTAIGCIPATGDLELVETVIEYLLGIAGGIAFLLIVYSGFLIMTSGGDARKLASGKQLLTAAISGLVLLVAGAYILNYVGTVLLKIFL